MDRYNEFRKITGRIPYSTIVIDYCNISDIISKGGSFDKLLDKKISEFEKQGITISSSLDYFENMIDEYIDKLLSILENEHLDCKNTIGCLFRKRASDNVEFEELLQRLEMEIASTNEEYKTVKNIYEKFNPLKNGKLITQEMDGGLEGGQKSE